MRPVLIDAPNNYADVRWRPVLEVTGCLVLGAHFQALSTRLLGSRREWLERYNKADPVGARCADGL